MTVFFYAGNTYCHPGSCESSYPGSPEQFYSPNRIVSGSQVVKGIPARRPVWQIINCHSKHTCHPGSFLETIRDFSCPSSRNFRRKYPGSPEQSFSSNRSVSGSQAVKGIPALGPVWQIINCHPKHSCHPGSCDSPYPGSPEQFYWLNKNVSGSQAVKKLPAWSRYNDVSVPLCRGYSWWQLPLLCI